MTPAVTALEAAGIPFELHEYAHDPGHESFGLEAAEALGVAPHRVFKTLLATLDGHELVVGIVPVDTMLSLKALARATSAKRAEMAEPHAAERATGFVTGGISPFGQKRRHRTVLDDSALALDVIHVSGGRRGLEIAIAPDDLLVVLDAITAAIAVPHR